MPQDSKVIIKEGYGALFWSMHSKHRQRWLRRHNNLSRHWLNNTLTPGGFSSHQPTFSSPAVVGIVNCIRTLPRQSGFVLRQSLGPRGAKPPKLPKLRLYIIICESVNKEMYEAYIQTELCSEIIWNLIYTFNIYILLQIHTPKWKAVLNLA